MRLHNSFEFTSYSFDGPSRTAEFIYTVFLKNRAPITLSEKLYFPREFPKGHSHDSALLESVLYNLHLILGISYWKMHCLKQLDINTHDLTKKQAYFWNTVYRKGLGEFFYKNSIDSRGLHIFPANAVEQAHQPQAVSDISKRALVGIGGGKDSVVALEILKNKKIETLGFYVSTDGRRGAEEEIVKIAGIDYLRVERTMDPQVIAMARTGEIPSGHVPVSALYAFVGILLGLLYNYSDVVTGNERSADYGNVRYLDEEINHQWSKSSEFEKLFSNYCNEFITPSIRYGSILREFSELKIVEMFTTFPNYFPVFSSCNNVSVRNGKFQKRWCCGCAKCAFVYACMAAFLPKSQLVSIFGVNLFADPTLVPIYRQLLGLKGIKPFDCVGTPEEVMVAMNKAKKNSEYTNDPVMIMFEQEIVAKGQNIAAYEEAIMNPSETIESYSDSLSI